MALAEQHDVIGFDIDAVRIGELNDGHDRTKEISPDVLKFVLVAFDEKGNRIGRGAG